MYHNVVRKVEMMLLKLASFSIVQYGTRKRFSVNDFSCNSF